MPTILSEILLYLGTLHFNKRGDGFANDADRRLYAVDQAELENEKIGLAEAR